MGELTDFQTIILSEAAARDDGAAVLPPGAAEDIFARLAASLIVRGWMREIESKPGALVWREDEKGRPLSLVITPAGRKAIGVEGARCSASLPEKSRRAVLSGVGAAAAAMAVPGQPVAARSLHPDAALLAMEPELEKLRAKNDRLSKIYSNAETSYFAERSRLSTELRASEAELDRLRAKYNLDAIQQAANKASELFWHRLREIADIRAKTLEGLTFKARWAEAGELAPSIIDDLLAL